MNNENMIKILQVIANKLEVNELGYDEEYEVIQYCQSMLMQKGGAENDT